MPKHETKIWWTGQWNHCYAVTCSCEWSAQDIRTKKEAMKKEAEHLKEMRIKGEN